MKLFIATPAYGGNCAVEHRNSMIALVRNLVLAQVDYQIATVADCSLVPFGRNELTKLFMASDCTHLLFVDADLGFDADDATLMIAGAEKEGFGVIGAAYPKKGIDWQAVKDAVVGNPEIEADDLLDSALSGKWTFHAGSGELKVNKPVEVDHVPAGLMLISRQAFEDVGFPWWDCAWLGNVYTGEDVLFCLRYRSRGGKIWMAPWVKTKHVGRMVFPGDIRKAAKAGVELCV